MDSDYAHARFNMVAQQIRPWGVLDESVLEVMGEIPRESFVPDAYRGLAYADVDIPIGEGRVMPAPKIAARMLQALAVQPTDKVLEVGTGTGYTTACLIRLGGRVVGVESDPVLADMARDRIASLGLRPVEIHVSGGLTEPTPGAPFHAIALDGSVPEMEMLAVLEGQLARGGRLFCVVGEGTAMTAWRISRTGAAEYRREALFETSLPSLPDCPAPERFVF